MENPGFSGKEELLFLIQFGVFQSLCENLQDTIKKEADPQSCLHGMIEMHLNYFVRHTNDLKIRFREIESLDGCFCRKVADKRKEHSGLTESISEKISSTFGGSSAFSRLAALYLFGTLDWIYQRYRPGRNPDASEITSQLYRTHLNGFLRMRHLEKL